MNSEIISGLYQPLEVKERKGAGNQLYKYIGNEDVIDRMNKVFLGDWSTTVMSKEIIDDYVLVEVQVSVINPETKERFNHVGFGSHAIARFTSGSNMGKIIDIGNTYKSALAKAIVNACTRWGVGLFKDRADFMEDDDGTPHMPSVFNASAPIPAPITPAPMAMAAPPVAQARPASKPLSMPSIPPAFNPAPIAAPPAFSVPPVQTSTVSVPKKVETPKVPLPNMNTQTVAVARPPSEVTLPHNAPSMPPQELPFSSSDDLGLISDVQRVALNGILSMRNLTYTDLAAEAFAASGITKEIPPVDKLKYEDAVVVLKYGNEKYRKNK